MSAGELRTPIEIQHSRETPDGQGGHTEEWVTVQRAYAMFRHTRGAEIAPFGTQEQNVATHVVKLRRSSHLTTKSRITSERGAREFDVVSVSEDERGSYQFARCVEVVA